MVGSSDILGPFFHDPCGKRHQQIAAKGTANAEEGTGVKDGNTPYLLGRCLGANLAFDPREFCMPAGASLPVQASPMAVGFVS